MEKTIAIQPTENPNIKAYHTRFEMCESLESGDRFNQDSLGEIGRMILKIRGVVQVHVTPYALQAQKAQLFNWDEISPQIEDLLTNFTKSQVGLQEFLDGGQSQDAGRIKGSGKLKPKIR